jgi:methylated-DNA-[protein]-cysteine S-methyltransferase
MEWERIHLYTHTYCSPIGNIHIAVDRSGRVFRLSFVDLGNMAEAYVLEENKYACGEVEYQLDRYFAGELKRFSLELAFDGTEFQRSVWQRLLKVQYGSVTTYGEIAKKIGKRDAARAVGNAVAANPLPIVVPCHRVVPASGRIGRYAVRSLNGSGTTAKRALLRLEGALHGANTVVPG